MSISWGAFGNRMIQTASAKRVPLIAQFELTARCNLQCRMCYVCKTGDHKETLMREKTAAEWIHLARQARDAGVLFLLLTGGEVFIRKDFQEIYQAVSEMGFSIQIYTNGTLITPEIANWLGKRPPSKVSVTLYGASAETYQKITGHADAYDKAIRGIQLLQNAGILTKIKTTIVKGNCRDAESIYDVAESFGMEFGTVYTIVGRREGIDTDPAAARLSPEDALLYEERLSDYLKAKAPIRDLLNNQSKTHYEKDIDEMVETRVPAGRVDNAFRCAAGHCAFWVTWDGRMTPCGSLPEPAADVFSLGLDESWRQLKKMTDDVPSCGDCIECSYARSCMRCPAKLYAENGSFTQCAEYFKKLAEGKQRQVKKII